MARERSLGLAPTCEGRAHAAAPARGAGTGELRTGGGVEHLGEHWEGELALQLILLLVVLLAERHA